MAYALNPVIVQELLGTSESVTTFIETAELILDEQLVGKGMSDARLTQIGHYLAAHFGTLTLKGGQIVREAIDGASDTFAGKFSNGLDLTMFGQQAMELDISKTLLAQSRQAIKPEFRVVGG